MARVALNMGRTEEAIRAAHEAASGLEGLPPGPHLGRVYDLIGGANLLFEDRAETERWSRRAIDIAVAVGDRYTVVSALSILGGANALQRLPSGIGELERSLAMAMAWAKMARTSSVAPTCSSPWAAVVHGRSI